MSFGSRSSRVEIFSHTARLVSSTTCSFSSRPLRSKRKAIGSTWVSTSRKLRSPRTTEISALSVTSEAM